MSGDNANNLTNAAVSASGEIDSTLIERFTGMVRGQRLKTELLSRFFDKEIVVGTNQVTSSDVGDTTLDTLVPGQEPKSNGVEADNHSLVVDTVVIARNTIALLHQFQNRIKMQTKMAKNHAKKIIMLQDETFLTQVMYGAATDEEISNTTGGAGVAISDSTYQGGRVSGRFGGMAVKLTNNGDESDPVQYLKAFETLVLKAMEKEAMDVEEMTFACPWAQYYVLMNNDHLVAREYTPGGPGANGSKIQGMVDKAYNIPILPTNRIRQKAHGANEHHQLSNAQNGYRYDTQGTVSSTSVNITNCVGVLFSMDSLLVGFTMDMDSDVFFSKRLKTNFIDTWCSFGAKPDELMACGAIFAHADYVPRRKFHEANDKNLMAE